MVRIFELPNYNNFFNILYKFICIFWKIILKEYYMLYFIYKKKLSGHKRKEKLYKPMYISNKYKNIVS